MSESLWHTLSGLRNVSERRPDGPGGWSEEIEERERERETPPPPVHYHYHLVTAAAGRVGFRRYHGGPPTILNEIMQSTQIFIKTESWLPLMFESSL